MKFYTKKQLKRLRVALIFESNKRTKYIVKHNLFKSVGKNVWLGGDVKVLAGVSIGDNTIIGTGSIVTKDIPANVIAIGNPCKVLREITDKDKTDYLERMGIS